LALSPDDRTKSDEICVNRLLTRISVFFEHRIGVAVFDIYLCIRDGHDLKFVVLAALICLLSSLTALALLRQAQSCAGKARLRWCSMAGASAGFGIWATHFVAMLGYAPEIVTGFQPALTLASLAIPIAALGTAFAIALKGLNRPALLTASLVAAGGIAAMHYIGTQALELPAIITWKPGFILASIILAWLPLYPALALVLEDRRLRGLLAATGLLSASVVALHFTGMTGLTLIPTRTAAPQLLISPREMAGAVTAVTLLLIAISTISLIVSRRTATALAMSERNFSFLVRGISDCAIYMLDLDGRVVNWNAGAQRLKGYAETEALGLHVSDFYTPEDREAELDRMTLGKARSERRYYGEGWRVRRDGTQFWAHVTMETMLDDLGQPIGFAKITRDMSRFKEAQDRIAEASRQRDAALGHMHQGLCLFDADERLVLSNPRYREMYGLAPDALKPGMPLSEVIRLSSACRFASDQIDARVETSQRAIRDNLASAAQSPILFEYPDGTVISIASRPMSDGGWVSTFDDITRQHESEAQIAHMAMHDGLTGLPNRTRFNLWIDEMLDQASRHGKRLGVTAIDLDRFKEINDTYGHAYGDVVLAELARRLQSVIGEDEIAARLGGDEFGLAKLFDTDEQLAEFLARVSPCFDEPVRHEKQDLSFGASLGVAAYPHDGTDREALLNNADLAMYRAKVQIGERICYYEPSMDETARARRQLANDLRLAIERQELVLLYQPQCQLRSGELSGYEALVRWHHPMQGLVSPADFIPIAEESGAILQIGEWVLTQACREAASWHSDHRIAVNVSPVQLVQQDLAPIVARVLAETGLSASRLELEITESAIITDKTRALNNLRQLKELGVAIAMDDFGTGYSSLDTLHSFPFDKIKIDKSFLLESDENEQARAIIRAVLALGQSLRIPVLAEGVETQSQFELLINEGCEEAQGYFLGRPDRAPSSNPESPEMAIEHREAEVA
jgi:diguanylate cyclase (GGDEF)-like protein/PAS domain S-box-containing protein